MPLVVRLFAASMFMIVFSAAPRADTACPFIGETSTKEIHWTEEIGVVTNGNNLLKNAPEGWNSAAFSSEYIDDDGALEFTANGTSVSRMLGFAYEHTDTRFEGIDYAIFLTSYGRLYIFEKGVQRGNYSSYNDGDVIRIERKNGVITYLNNGNELYVSNVPSTGNLYVDASLYSKSATIGGAKIFGAGTVTVNIEWMDLVDVKIEEDMLEKSGGKGWHSGAASIQNILGDGALEITALNNDDTIVFGLSRENQDAGFKNIRYAIFLSANGSFYIYEDGFNKGSFGNYEKKDVFRIERQGRAVTYKHNCESFYVSKLPSNRGLIADVALYSKGAKIKNAVMYGASL